MTRPLVKSRNRLVLATFAAAVAVYAVAAEVTRLERRRAEYRERAESHAREARRFEESARAASDAVAVMRRCVEKMRRSAEECALNAGREAPGFVRDLWDERAADFLREAARIDLEADALEGAAAARREDAAAMLRSARRYEALIEHAEPDIIP